MLQPTHAPLTFDEHRELSSEIGKSRDRLRELHHLIVTVYGAQSFAGLSFSNLHASFDRLSAELRLQAERDCPGAGAGELYR